jgi:RHS repeat-associated protein
MNIFTCYSAKAALQSFIAITCVYTTSFVYAAAPQINNAPILTATVGSIYTYDLGATDTDNDPLSYSVATWPTGLDISISDQGLVSWVLDDHNDAGQYVIMAYAYDDQSEQDLVSYNLTVTDPANHIPVINNDPMGSALVGSTYTYDLNAADADNDTLRYSVATWPSGIEMSISEQGLLSWVLDDRDDVGDYVITVRVDDGNLGVSTRRYSLTVSDLSNRPPVINSQPIPTATVGNTYTYAVNASDADNDALSYEVSTWPRGLNVTMSDTGVIQWVLEDRDEAGEYLITAKVKDGHLGTDVQTYRLTVVDPTNHVPVINNAPVLTATVGTPYVYDLSATDGDNDTLQYSLSTWPYGLDVSISQQGVISWDLDEHNDAGKYTIIAHVNDGNQGKQAVRYQLTVIDPNNQAPVINGSPIVEAQLGTTYTYGVNATDADNDPLRYSVSTWPYGLNVTISEQGTVSWVLDDSVIEGRYLIDVRVYDDNLGKDSLRYDLTVSGHANPDSDGDGIADADDAFPNDPLQSQDSDGNGVGDNKVTSQAVTYTYNDNSQILTINGPRTDVDDITTYTYDSDGYRNSITNALGHVITLSNFNGRGEPQQITDANGTVTTLTYHVRGWLLSSSIQHSSNDPTLASTTTYGYDNAGNVTQVTLPNGNELNYHYDTSDRLIAVSNNAGERIDYVLDNADNRTAQTISDTGSTITYRMTQAYDELSRVMEVVGADSQTTQIDYDVNDNPVQTTNPRSHASQNQYDPLDRLTQTTDANNGITQFTYDTQDRLTSVTDANGNATTYQYNAFDHLIQQTSPDTGITRYVYDNGGNRVASVDSRGIVSQYSYDALNRLTQVSYPLSPEENITYTYDVSIYTTPDNQVLTINGKGRLFSVQDQSGQQLYAYDHRGNVSSHARIIGDEANSPVYWTDYVYDAGNQLIEKQVFLPSGELSYAINYSYDTLGRVSDLSYQTTSGGNSNALVSNLQYLPFGGVTALTYGNGNTTQLAYDQDYRLSTWQTQTDSVTLIDRSYNYDENSNIIQIDHLEELNNTQDFGYDLLDRLDSHLGQASNTGWTYDLVGNRLTENTDDYGYDLSSNLLLDIQHINNVTNYTLDDRGNTTQITQGSSIATFTYNAANRPVSVVKDGITTNYRYNTLGQRISKTQGVNTVHYTYNLQGQLTAEYATNGQPLVEYIYLANQPLAQLRGGDVYYYHNDHLGTPIAMTDQNQQMVWHAAYTAFGEATLTTQVVENNLRFPGQYFDQETELHYNYFRYYDPSTGRYTQSDPIGLLAGSNTYAYALNSPFKYSDYYGLASVLVTYGGESASPRGGANAQAGVFVTTGGATGPADAGVVVSGGVSVGYRNDAGFNLTLLKGGRENIDGRTLTVTLDFGVISVASHTNLDTGKWSGVSVGANSASPGISVSVSVATSVSIRDLFRSNHGQDYRSSDGRTKAKRSRRRPKNKERNVCD